MLKTILSVSGRPGLYKMVSQGKNMLIVESLTDKKRIPTYNRDKVISLGDVAVYTTETEVPLYKVLNSVKTKEEGKSAAIDLHVATSDDLRAYMAEILPDFDRDRVYPTDIKRLLSWYNILLSAGITDFEPEKEEAEEAEKEESVKDESKKAAKTTKTAAVKEVSVPKKAATRARQPVAKTTQRTRQK
jgi:hypothetical protein